MPSDQPERHRVLKAIGWGAAIVVMLFFALVNVYACVAPYILLAQHLN